MLSSTGFYSDKELEMMNEIEDTIYQFARKYKPQKEHTIQCQTDEIAILKNKIEKLEQAITYLTEGKATPEEILKKLNKNATLALWCQSYQKDISNDVLLYLRKIRRFLW